ncbi:MAG: small ribosomal subunit Rsm22 family protein [Holosporaceae bacterium]|jgi:ribosomal protein RSM22 (predicted rRNA methylase)|nr:small ribosomal subunit Rsm22 family protein [Holosporaceae bacterium]
MYTLPESVKSDLRKIAEEIDSASLRKGYASISKAYGSSAFGKKMSRCEAVAYAVARMPATFGAISYVINRFRKKVPGFRFDKVLDAGSGTGALAAFFISEGINVAYTAVEKDGNMAKVFTQLTKGCGFFVELFEEDSGDFFDKFKDRKFGCSFLVYSLNEMKDKIGILKKIFAATEDFVFVIEPGTPEGFKNILSAKKLANSEGCSVVAPCVSENCGLREDDWCHFCVRISRSEDHVRIKNASLFREDEKFSYIITARNSFKPVCGDRIIKRPMKRSGHIIFDVCSENGIKRKVLANGTVKGKYLWGDELERKQ